MFITIPHLYMGFGGGGGWGGSNSSPHFYLANALPIKQSPYPNVDVLIMSYKNCSPVLNEDFGVLGFLLL